MFGFSKAKTAYSIYQRGGFTTLLDSGLRYCRRNMNQYLAVGYVDDYFFQESIKRLRTCKQKERGPKDAIYTTQKYSGIDPYRTIELQQHEGDTRKLIQHLVSEDIRSVLEVGTAHGGSLYLWTRLPETQNVVSVDKGFYPLQKQKLFKEYDPDTEVQTVIGNSHDVEIQQRLQTRSARVRIWFLLMETTVSRV